MAQEVVGFVREHRLGPGDLVELAIEPGGDPQAVVRALSALAARLEVYGVVLMVHDGAVHLRPHRGANLERMVETAGRARHVAAVVRDLLVGGLNGPPLPGDGDLFSAVERIAHVIHDLDGLVVQLRRLSSGPVQLALDVVPADERDAALGAARLLEDRLLAALGDEAQDIDAELRYLPGRTEPWVAEVGSSLLGTGLTAPDAVRALFASVDAARARLEDMGLDAAAADVAIRLGAG